ncbi:hypothetical protein C0Q61_14645 [Streptomyces albidoflavus]|nr:hypothetical protein C0Q61_14645 [Streptomyces albidoflavus]RZE14618.1 hypothetical protein C0Q66_00435 [Streptomyces albidoflavus]
MADLVISYQASHRLNFSSAATGQSTRWPTTRFEPSGGHYLAPVQGLNGTFTIAAHRSSSSPTAARAR